MGKKDSARRSRGYWDNEASTFDEEPDHGLRDPLIRQAWADEFDSVLPSPPAEVLDIGCGTGSLSVLLSSMGYTVTAIDSSPAMVALARQKAKSASSLVAIHVMDACRPRLGPRQFDVIVCRHLLWALPEPPKVVKRWVEMLAPGGRLILIEGHWGTGVGMHAGEVTGALPPSLTDVTVRGLSDRAELWGGRTSDERYVVVASR